MQQYLLSCNTIFALLYYNVTIYKIGVDGIIRVKQFSGGKPFRF